MSGGRHFAGGVRGWPDSGGPDMRGGRRPWQTHRCAGGGPGRPSREDAPDARTHPIPGVEPVSPMVRPRRACGAAAGWACGRWSPLTPYLSMAIAISPVSEALGVVTRRICKAFTLGSGDVNEAV